MGSPEELLYSSSYYSSLFYYWSDFIGNGRWGKLDVSESLQALGGAGQPLANRAAVR